ncbi:hypothetical protein HELRODRAFT_177084 [Helobdella robusta]|uniref:Endonuclease/exonuclease/phosphatase domain-containing protein n=1 Tax=Helobdella robusta TaxID=6412 RepID=T1FB79_HELRO|nr:hypothetical protein HELRODRAFT_177084 [Helobdella robusta]ESN98217.1 hypothetical protein HELRODRAFT_177084 [Helobdella robusta]
MERASGRRSAAAIRPHWEHRRKKNRFYEQLNTAVNATPFEHQLFELGDFNARVGLDHDIWRGVLGRNGLGKVNSNGIRLLEFCAVQKLAVTNTVFQQSNKLKTTWMHPRLGHWHLIDYVIKRQRDLRNVRLTRAIRATTLWSDHRLVKMSIFLLVKPVKRHHRVRKHLIASLFKRFTTKTKGVKLADLKTLKGRCKNFENVYIFTCEPTSFVIWKVLAHGFSRSAFGSSSNN